MKEKTTLSLVVVVLLLTSGIAVTVAANGSFIPMGLKEIAGYVFLGLAFILAAIAYAYVFIRRREERIRERERAGEKEKDEVEKVIKILKEAKRIKEEIEKRGENLTHESEIILSRIEARLDTGINNLEALMVSGINDLKTLILFEIGIMLALALTIISML